MSPFDFDTPIDRTAFPTMSVNRGALGDIFGNPDALPLWVADMDFPAPERVPGVSLIAPQGTYLVWVDFTGLGMGAKDLHRFIVQDAGLAISAGHWFGREGAGYARMNIATPRENLRVALEGLAVAVEGLA